MLGDASMSADAFTRLWSLVQERLARAAKRFGLSEDDANDVVQSVSIRLWERRASFTDFGVGAFWAYAFRMVKNLAIDRTRRDRRFEMVEVNDDTISAADSPYVEALVEAALERGELTSLADRLWLGDPPRSSDSVLAVQLCLTEGVTPLEAAAILGLDPPTVERLLHTPEVARYAAYAALMWPSEELVAYVLDPSSSSSQSDPAEILRRSRAGEEVPMGAWAASEVPPVILHVLYGMNMEEIVRVLAPATNPVEVTAVIHRAVDVYPFARIASNVATALHACLEEVLRNGDFWRRLVFEYHTHVQLPHRQILDRTGPAAAVFSFDLKPTTLNSWIGNGRLWSQLAAFAAKEAAR